MLVLKSQTIVVKPFGTRRQAVVSVGDTQMVVGLPSIRDTLTGVTRPVDLLLATLAIDCTFTCQDAAAALDASIYHLSTSARWLDAQHAEIAFSMNDLGTQHTPQIIAFIEANSQIYRLLAPVITIDFRITG